MSTSTASSLGAGAAAAAAAAGAAPVAAGAAAPLPPPTVSRVFWPASSTSSMFLPSRDLTRSSTFSASTSMLSLLSRADTSAAEGVALPPKTSNK
ncbi:hypothetical protein BASA81_001082 [Batrachochytrium salamandrivorans]|nr:hypothetical protein BASA81_001082 [Batrachochytrium salamandrivorans]